MTNGSVVNRLLEAKQTHPRSITFGQWVPIGGTLLDLGAGYCEFINNVRADVKYGMDFKPRYSQESGSEVTVLQQDCLERWPLREAERRMTAGSGPVQRAVSYQSCVSGATSVTN
jgi:hypothetical protein